MIPRLLFVFAWQLEILVTTLNLWVSEEDYGYLMSIDEINRLCGCESVSIAVKKRRCKWFGYVSLCYSAVLAWVPDGKQSVGRSRTTWRRTTEREKAEAGWA